MYHKGLGVNRTMAWPESGLKKPQLRAIQALKIIWAVFTIMVMVFPKTAARPAFGMKKPQYRAMQKLNTIWVFCTIMVMGLP
jgi:hypothetical protein